MAGTCCTLGEEEPLKGCQESGEGGQTKGIGALKVMTRARVLLEAALGTFPHTWCAGETFLTFAPCITYPQEGTFGQQTFLG
jgi:hypothetical protein